MLGPPDMARMKSRPFPLEITHMKRLTPILTLAFLILATVHSDAQTAAKKAAPAKPAAAPAQPTGGPGPKKTMTVTGEILDMGCFTSRGLRGDLHRECALNCLRSGVPMGLITADSTVYILTQNHDRAMTPTAFPPPDPFAQCKGWPSFQVEVNGYVWERKGMKALEVLRAKLLPAPPAAAAPAKP
jgi:hypothetical protein